MSCVSSPFVVGISFCFCLSSLVGVVSFFFLLCGLFLWTGFLVFFYLSLLWPLVILSIVFTFFLFGYLWLPLPFGVVVHIGGMCFLCWRCVAVWQCFLVLHSLAVRCCFCVLSCSLFCLFFSFAVFGGFRVSIAFVLPCLFGIY